MRFWQLIRKYINRKKDDIRSSELIVEMPYPALINTSILTETLLSKLITEVRVLCGEKGYEIDSVVFCSFFDSPIIVSQNHITAKSDDYVAIYRRKDTSCFAVVFNGSWAEAK
tara:strand:+ start:763 stop:1101 length:339 start_codon:yes stop_codon:yes gene_type:complete